MSAGKTPTTESATGDVRVVTPQEVKAFSHPLRMRLYSLLSDLGEATATQLARATGESSGQTSYHLRQLEKFGFVADAERESRGRERWWRAVGFSLGSKDAPAGPASEGVRTLARFFVDEHAEVLRRWQEQQVHEPREWVDATASMTTATDMTADELDRLTRALTETVMEHSRAADERAAKGDGTPRRRVRVYVDTLVLPEAPA